MEAEARVGWFSTREGIFLVWAGVLAGPIGWAIELGASYAIVQWTCGTQHTFVLRLIELGSLAIVAMGAIAAWRALNAAPAGAPLDGGHPDERGRFMAVLGLAACAFFALVIVALAVPPWFLNACQS
jgi:hypothetical protein